jgi:hypothetical protein
MDRANRSRLWYRSHDLHRMHAMRPILSLCNVNDLSELLCLASLLTGITLRFAYGFLLWPVRRWTVSVHTRRSFLARNPRSCGLVYHTCSHYGILRMSNIERLDISFNKGRYSANLFLLQVGSTHCAITTDRQYQKWPEPSQTWSRAIY